MKFGVPWNEKDLAPDARQTASEAARRSGMSVGEWLNAVIINSAAGAGVVPKSPPRDDGEEHRVQRRPGSYTAADEDLHWGNAREDSLAAVTERLDTLTQQLERLARYQNANSHHATAPAGAEPADSAPEHPSQVSFPPRAAAAPPARRLDDDTTRRLADSIAQLDQRLNQLISEGRAASNEIERKVNAVDRMLSTMNRENPRSPFVDDPLDRAVAEIAARQRALDGEGEAPSAPERISPGPSPWLDAPRPDISGLEQQLRSLTTQIEGMRRPCGVEDAVAALRADLSEIGRTLTEAMPQRAVAVLESEIGKLAERVDHSRRDGVDASALAGVERGLAEVRDALHNLTPAENLVGFPDAVRALEQKIKVVASTQQDPAALQQLEAAIGALRGIVAHVASNDALTALSDEVRGLAAKVDRIANSAGGDMLSALDSRIAHLAGAIEARGGGASAAAPQLEATVQGLIDKVENLQLTRGDHVALGHLEDRIATLVEKLDASDSRLSHLESIERGLADLLIHLQELRGSGMRVAGAAPAPGVDLLKHDLEQLKETERRNADSLEVVHGTLGHVVDRLVMIESDMRSSEGAGRAEAAAPTPASAIERKPSGLAIPLPASAPPPAPARPPPPPREHRPIDPNLPPDHPLEPGSAAQRGNTASAADRIAASEAALGKAKPPVIDDPGGKSNFIAAARRAAKAATAEDFLRPSPAAPGPAAEPAKPGSGLGQKLRMILIGASVVIIVLGALRIATHLLIPSDDNASDAPAANKTGEAAPIRPNVKIGSRETAPASGSRPGLLRPDDPIFNGLTMAPAGGVLIPDDTTGSTSSLPAPKTLPAKPANDITGSLPRPPAASPAASSPAVPAMPATPAADNALPAAIGSPALREAAAKNNPAAAYEVAIRYAEGQGVPQNPAEAARWYERAANQGLAPAQFRLGSMYEKGVGVKKDIEAARKLYLAAADQGNAKAMHNLAVLHAEGIDGKPNFQSAAQWFRKAADRGVADSQYNLGILYARGIGVEQNLAESYKWFTLAAQQGDKDSVKKRDDVAGRLDQQSLMAAKLAVQTWTPDPQPESATTVRAPPGGWDRPLAGIGPVKPKSRPGTALKPAP